MHKKYTITTRQSEK